MGVGHQPHAIVPSVSDADVQDMQELRPDRAEQRSYAATPPVVTTTITVTMAATVTLLASDARPVSGAAVAARMAPCHSAIAGDGQTWVWTATSDENGTRSGDSRFPVCLLGINTKMARSW